MSLKRPEQLHHRLALLTTFGLLATPLAAAPLTLVFPVPATQTGARSDAPARVSVAIAAFDGAKVPTRIVEGSLDQRAYRLEGVQGNTLALMLSLQAQVEQAGFAVLFDCATTACGGFDFRYGIDLLPEPEMHVDLGDFHYLAARNSAGDVVTLMVSRAADQGFVQVTSVTRGANLTTAQTTAPAVPETTDPIQPAPALAPEPQTEAAAQPGSLGAQLLALGAVALDDLVFASGKAVLEDGDYASLAALADWLKANPDLTVTLVGHTDASGSLAGNVALSKQRAAAVRAVLIQKYTLPASRMNAEGAGYLAPRATNQTPEGRQNNRRVEVMLTSTPAREQ